MLISSFKSESSEVNLNFQIQVNLKNLSEYLFQANPRGFGDEDTEDVRPATLQLKKGYWQCMKGSKLLWKWLVLKHISFWNPDCLCWAGCSEGWLPSTHGPFHNFTFFAICTYILSKYLGSGDTEKCTHLHAYTYRPFPEDYTCWSSHKNRQASIKYFLTLAFFNIMCLLFRISLEHEIMLYCRTLTLITSISDITSYTLISHNAQIIYLTALNSMRERLW